MKLKLWSMYGAWVYNYPFLFLNFPMLSYTLNIMLILIKIKFQQEKRVRLLNQKWTQIQGEGFSFCNMVKTREIHRLLLLFQWGPLLMSQFLLLLCRQGEIGFRWRKK